MTKLEVPRRSGAAAMREPRPFVYLKPASLPMPQLVEDPAGAARLDDAVQEWIPQLARSIVDFTIARDNARSGHPAPIGMSVLNRRRRAARAWLQLLAAGRADAGARHVVATQWLPILCGTGPDLLLARAPARELVEFVRGAVTACIFDAARAELLLDARAHYLFESALAAHLAAVREAIARR